METTILTVNNVWMMVCTALVFFMHLGFSFLEIGLTRQKNTINILFKNFFVITIGLLLYCIGGFNLMYPGFEDGDIGILKFAGFGISAPEGGMGFDMLTVVTPGGPISFSRVCLLLLQPPSFLEQLLSVSNYQVLCFLLPSTSDLFIPL